MQADGTPSFGVARGHIDRALGRRGALLRVDAPRRARATTFPARSAWCACPPPASRLIRGSITDITERKRSEFLAIGRAPRLRAHHRQRRTCPDDARGHRGDGRARHAGLAVRGHPVRRRRPNMLRHVAGRRLPHHFQQALEQVEVGPRNGSCAAAIFLQRQVDRRRDRARRALGAPARAGAGRRPARLLVDADPRLRRPHARHGRALFPPAAQPAEARLRADGAPHRARRHRDRAQAVRGGPAPQRGALPRPVRERDRGRLPRPTPTGRLESANPALVEHARLRAASRNCSRCRPPSQLYVDPADREPRRRDPAPRRHGAQRGIPAAPPRRPRHHRRRERARACATPTATSSATKARSPTSPSASAPRCSSPRRRRRRRSRCSRSATRCITADADGRIEYLNPVAEELTGWTDRRGAPAGRSARCSRSLNESTRQPIDSPILRCLREGRIVELAEPSLLVNRRGQEISIQDSAAPIRDRAGTLIGAVMVFHDVSQERRLQRALTYQATHDALTGPHQPPRVREPPERGAAGGAPGSTTLSHVLMYLDLDQFKVVNDTCGHEAGDRLLKQVTSVVQTRIRTTDTLARLGGDEFGVLLQRLHARHRAAHRREPAPGDPRLPLRLAGPRHERRRVDRPRRDQRPVPRRSPP